MRRIYRFLRCNRHKKTALLIYLYSAWYRARILAGKSRTLLLKAGIRGEESPAQADAEQYRKAAVISGEIQRICSHTMWESKCLVQALTAGRLLRREGIPATMYLGVGRDETEGMIAHAWIRCGEFYVTGGDGKGLAVVDRIYIGG
jgi:hypothetical protein